MTEYDPAKVKRVVVYLSEYEYEYLWKLAFRRGCRSGICGTVSVSKLLRQLGSGHYRLVKQKPGESRSEEG